MIASKTLCIKVYHNQGRPRKELGPKLEKWLFDFLDRPNISRQKLEGKMQYISEIKWKKTA